MCKEHFQQGSEKSRAVKINAAKVWELFLQCLVTNVKGLFYMLCYECTFAKESKLLDQLVPGES